jgi:hypothetical protein
VKRPSINNDSTIIHEETLKPIIKFRAYNIPKINRDTISQLLPTKYEVSNANNNSKIDKENLDNNINFDENDELQFA